MPDFPDWIKKKHPSVVFGKYLIHTRAEIKIYDNEVFSDIGACLSSEPDWLTSYHTGLHIVCMHECGGVVKVVITPDEVKRATWIDRPDQEDFHCYCGECHVPC